MTRKKRIKDKLGAPSEKENKNPFLKTDGSLDLIEKFPEYKDKKKSKKRR